MGPVAKQVRKRVGTLSVKLHELFRQYIASGKVPSVQSLKKAKFKFWPGKCYAYGFLKRKSRISVLSDTDGDKLCPKVYAEGFVLERFRAWAKRMKVSQDGRLLFVGNDKIIIPKEHFPELVRKVHTKDGATGLKHRSFVKTLKVLRKMYSIGRRQFGVSPQFVKNIVQYCTDEKCSAKQYKLRRNRGMLTDDTLSTESPHHGSESDSSLPESHGDGDDDKMTETDMNTDTIDVVSVENPCDSGNNVQDLTSDHWKCDSVTNAGSELVSDFHHELLNLAPKCSRVPEREADCGFGNNRSLAVMLDSEQSTRDDAPQRTPPGKLPSRVAAQQDKTSQSHGMDKKMCHKSAVKTPDVHKVCAPLWTPPAPQTTQVVQASVDKKSPKQGHTNSCTSSKHQASPLDPKTLFPRQMVGRQGSKEIAQSTGKIVKGSCWEFSAGIVHANKSTPVDTKNTSCGMDNQYNRRKMAGVVVTSHTKKFGQLLDVVRQMKMDIGPACANNQMALERLKQKIHIGLSVLTECRCLLHKYEETQWSATSHYK